MIEDDRRLAALVIEYLTHAGFDVAHAETAAEGVAWLKQHTADLVLLDLMLPDGDGLEVCRRIRAGSDVPIVMLTARGEATDRVVGLELGADDYLPKPFEPRELLARVRAVLRRQRGTNVADGDMAPLRFGRLEIDPGARRVRVDRSERELTARQFDLLLALAQRAGRVLSREQIMDAIKGEALEAFDRSIDVHIARIRAAIEDDPKAPRRIVTVRGAGYVFARVQDA
ncbi:MAG: response regulator transcription factor [Burkholderiales bacterium]|nr:response regulator transcription factor [Burkholderiales bacterium]